MNSDRQNLTIRSTTVILVRRDGRVAMAGDGQVTLGETVIKGKRERSDESLTETSSPVSPARPPMHSRY